MSKRSDKVSVRTVIPQEPRPTVGSRGTSEVLHVVIERAPIPWRRILIALGTVAAAVLAYWLIEHLHDLLIMLVVAALVAFIIDPVVVRLQKYVRRWVGIVVTYVGLVAVLSLAVLSIVPTIVQEVHGLEDSIPQLQNSVREYTDTLNQRLERLPDQAREQIQNVQAWMSETGRSMLGTFFSVLIASLGWMGKGMIMLVLSIYLLLDKDRIRDGVLGLLPAAARSETVAVAGDVLDVLHAYLRGQIVVIGFVAVFVTVILILFGVPYALTIGTIAGILEVIPYFGAVAGAIPAVTYTFWTHGLVSGLFMIGFFIILNQAEGHIVIPWVMGRSLEMRPITVLLALLVGAELGGIIGLIVAVPVARILQVFVEHGVQIYKDLRELSAEGPLEEAKASDGHVAAGPEHKVDTGEVLQDPEKNSPKRPPTLVETHVERREHHGPDTVE